MMKKTWIWTLGALTLSLPTQAQLVINEVMQSNIDCIIDDMNDYPDSWVELYNSGDAPVSLADYSIGLTDNPAKAWKLPNVTVEKGRSRLVWCDKVGQGLHTDFRLESGKNGAVWLFRRGVAVDQLTKMKKQPAPNISYGRKTDGADSWGYMAQSTPGSANCGKTCKDILGSPVFSESGRVIEQGTALTIALTMPEDSPVGTVIRYTFDGSEPTESSAEYYSPLTLTNTSVVRAKLFCEGYLSPRSVTQSYIFHNRTMTLPVVSIVSDADYFYGSKRGILVKGNYDPNTPNYKFDWRRPVNLEYFTSAGQKSQLNQLCETRVMGNASRDAALKSLAIYANKRFGEKRFQYSFFPDQRPGITDYKSLALRNAGNDFDYLYMRDAVIQRAMAIHADLDWQAWSPAIVYLNGVYKGILNIRERSNEDNIYSNYDGLEDIDMFENGYELKAGDWTNYNAFKAFYQERGHTMAEYEKWMDCQEYINLMIMNLFFNNQDFPGNNIVIWRPRTEGGRWRWIAKDTDFGLGLYGSSPDYKTLEWLYNPDYDKDHAWANSPEATMLFRHLMEDADFRRAFIDRCAIYMGDFLSEKSVRVLWDAMYDQIREEYPVHRKLFNQWWPNYAEELSKARTWLSQRIPNFYGQLADYYKIGTPVPLSINTTMSETDARQLTLTFNGVRLTEAAFDGKYFAGQTITLEGDCTDGLEVKEWVITQQQGTSTTTSTQQGSHCVLKMPDCASVTITPVLGERTGVAKPASTSWQWHFAEGQLTVSQVPVGVSVYVFDLAGRVLHHAISTGQSIQCPVTARQVILRVGSDSVKALCE